MKWKMKRLLGLFLSLALVLGLFPGMSLTAYAAGVFINAFGGQSVTISSDQTCTSFDVLDGSTLTVNQGVTLTLNISNGYSFNFFDNSNLELHGTLAGSVGSGATWMDDTYINVYLSDGAKFTVTGLSCMDGDNYLRYYGYDAATDGNGTVSVMNGTTDVTASSIGYKTTTYTFTATPSSGYRFVSWTKGASGEVLGTDASINVTCEQNGQYQVYANFEVAHTHSFTYSASGDTITATCSVANCTLTDSKATLTIAAPALTTYGGTGDATATLTGLSDFNTATGKTIAATDIKYVGRDSTTYEESTTAPTDAGKYTAKITVEDKTASVDYEIAKADPTATAPTATATYGQTLADVTLNNPDGNTAGTWAWVDSTTSVGTVGEHTFKANFTPTDTTNYNSKSNVDVTVTVGKAANPATVTSTASVTKGGNTVDLANNVTKNGATGAVSYEISGEANGCSLNGSVLTSGSNTGSVTVNVTIAEDSNYNALAATPITVTISDKGTQTISAEPVTATYGDTDKSVSATVTDPATGGGAISYAVKSGDAVTVDENTGALTIVKAGSAVITVTAAETATYAQATKDVNVTVNTKAMTVSAENVNVTVDGQPHGITVNVTDPASGATVKYGTEVGTYNLDASPTQTEAGELTVYYQVTADNYTTYTGSAKVTVNAKQTQTITASDVTATYGDTDKSVSGTTTGDGAISYSVKSGDAVTVDENTGALTIVKAGSAVITVTAAETATYAQATKDVNVTVNKAAPTVTAPTVKALTYNGQKQELVNAGSTEDGTLYYAVTTENTAPTDESLYTASIPAKTDAGTYYVWYMVKGNDNYNDSKPEYVTVTISEKDAAEVTKAPEANDLTYTGSAQELVTAGEAEGGTMQYALGEDTKTAPDSTKYGTSIPKGTDAKTYYVWYMAKGDDTHKDSKPVCVLVTISKKQEIKYTVTFKVKNGSWNDEKTDDITVDLTGEDGKNPTLSDKDIPEVGKKPSEGYKEGSWDTEPEAGTKITKNTTYTYTYEKEDKPVEPKIELDKSEVTLKTGDKATVKATTVPEDQKVTWTSSAEAVATVSESGEIEGIAEGTATVTATMTVDSKDYKATVSVTVSEDEPGTVATPTFSPEGGTYSDPQMVSINSETSGATIYYTTDGTLPVVGSSIYTSPITVHETTTIKAIGVKEGMTDSSVASVTYTISEEPEPGPEPEPSEDTKVDVGGLSDGDITDDLRGKGYDSVESIESALQTALSIETEEKKENSELVDAKLMISTDGGETWQEATLENFPEGGIDVILPYPDGTNGNEYSFSVAHMIGAGDRAGEIETPSTTNTASGISAHFNGLSPVMITWTKNSSPSKDDSKSEEKAHTHHYVWETVEATEESDGEFRYVCDICGAVQTRVPITAYYVFNKNTTEKIRKAGQGATVKIETYRWISFHKMVMEALAERPDVSLEVSFLDGEYKGNMVSFKIPAGTDTLSLLDENGFSGFLYLAGKFGTAN